MAKNKIITSQGNVQFINSKGKTINMHPMHCYAVYQDDTVSFLFIYMKEYSGQAFFASQFEDLEVNGETYDNMDDLKDAINYAFAKAGAQARTEIVEELPEDPFTNTIYLIKKEHGEGYDEWVWNEDEGWQLIGDTDIEFERYLEKTEFYDYSAATEVKIDYISGAVDDNASDIQFISGAVDTEISDREAADAVISGAVDTLSTNLSNEVSRAQNAEQTLQNNINTVNSRVDAEQIARANVDNALSGAVDSVASDLASEVSRATAKENEIDSKVDGEISDREAADTAISGAVDTLSTNLSNEVQRAQNAESALNSNVNALSGEVETMGDEAFVDAEYVSSSTTIDFYNASGAVVAQVDATDFITDGMIEDVRIETISGVTYLVIDFNTASGKEDIKIPLTDIFNPDNYYDKTAVDGFVSDLEVADSVISGAVDNVSSDLATESQRAQNAEGALSGAIDTKLAISDFNTYSASVETALSGKANASDVYTKSEVYTKAEVDEAISEIDLSDYYNKTEVDGKLADKADLSALTEDERVWGEALNDLNSRINTVSGDVAGKQNALVAGENISIVGNVISAQGGGSSYTAGDGIDITNDVISVTGKADTSAVTAIQDSLSGYVTTDTEQEITAQKTFVTNSSSSSAKKLIKFKQGVDGAKLGFVLTTSATTNNELGTFEFRPNTFTIDNVQHPLMYFGHYRNTGIANAGVPQTVIGFRQYDQVNAAAYHYLMPLPEKAKTSFGLTTSFKDYYAPMGFKNGSTMITADNTGVVDLSSELDGLKLKKLTQAEYDALTTKDSNTLYIISD